MKSFLFAAAALLALTTAAQATSGPGCLRIVNVASWDVLNIRKKPSANAAIVFGIDPQNYGVISLRGKCTPENLPWGSRWCPVTYYSGNGTYRGFVKARFVRDNDCP